MKDIQNVMFEKLNKNDYGKILLRYAAILIYISVGRDFLNMLPMPRFVMVIMSYTSGIVYFGYIAGLIGCFAKRDFMPIMIAFFYNTVSWIISCVRWFSFNGIVNIAVYAFLGYWAFKCFTEERACSDIPSVNGKKFCPNCGREVSADASFCGSCGQKF